MQQLGVDFDKSKSKVINYLDYKESVIKYVKRANCPVCFTDKELSCAEAIVAIENGTREGIAICKRFVDDALYAMNNR